MHRMTSLLLSNFYDFSQIIASLMGSKGDVVLMEIASQSLYSSICTSLSEIKCIY